jgi:hypothetical protein
LASRQCRSPWPTAASSPEKSGRVKRACRREYSGTQKRRRDELRPVVRSQVFRRAVKANELRQHFDHAPRPNAAGHVDGQTFAGELVDHGEALQRPIVRARVEDEGVRPHVIDRGGGQRPRPTGGDTPAWPTLRDLQTGLAPQPIGALRTHVVSFPLEEDANLPVAVPRVLRGDRPHVRQDGRIAGSQPRLVSQRRAGDRQQGARAAARQAARPCKPVAGARVRLPFCSGDLLEHVNLEIAVGHHLLQPAILGLELRNRFTSAGSRVPKRLRQA